MFGAFKRWRNRRIIRNAQITEFQWQRAFSRLPLLDRLNPVEKISLRELATLFIHKKEFTGAHGFHVTRDMELLIALQACLPILHLDIDWYRNWISVIVYPDSFETESTMVDGQGIMHKVRRALSGEAWQRGPVILSWRGADGSDNLDGSNLVIHEFVHKLDMLNGKANGFPPLHAGMNRSDWTSAFSAAFDEFQARLVEGEWNGIDPYAGHSPAEFLAVLSEVFFERPDLVRDLYPAVYEQMVLFFRQNPLCQDR